MLGEKCNQQTQKKKKKKRITSLEQTTKRKKTTVSFFETWPSYEMKIKYRRAVHHINLAQQIILSLNRVTKSLGKFERRFK